MAIFDKKIIKDNIDNKRPFTISFKYADLEMLMFINGVYTMLLTAHDQLYILNSVISIMREVLTNAQKANAKRLYFARKDLDINDSADYQKGMRGFKDEIMQKHDELHDILSKSDFTVDIDFSISDAGSVISLRNNAAVLPGELERIHLRLEKARSYTSLMDAYEELEDGTEGAGLGIALVVVTLKNIGIDPNFFGIESGKSSTTVSLRIPRRLKPHEIITKIKTRILEEIKDLPPFPSNAVRIMELCDDPEASIDAIADGIMSDPALASGVIKLSNSAAFISAKRIESINDAVRNLGLRNIRALIMASSARRIMEERFSNFEEIWAHSSRVAGYARFLGLEFHGPAIAEKTSLAGLLHDMGKIILLATDPATAQKIAEHVKDRALITETFMEEISLGISHAAMGGFIAEKWNFPNFLSEAIRRHHDPLSASKENEPVVQAVYLANMCCGIESRKYSYQYIYESVLENFRLSDEASFNALHSAMQQAFDGR